VLSAKNVFTTSHIAPMHSMNLCLLGLLAVLHSLTDQALAQIDLGTAAQFGVIAATAITNTGPTIVDGRLGIFPNGFDSITGFPPGLSGPVFAGDNVALQARTDAVNAFFTAASLPGTAQIGPDLGGQVLVAGVYDSATSVGITGTLVLDGQDNLNAVFVFRIASSLTTGAASAIVLTNGAQACNVFWRVGSSATLGTASTFAGKILALNSITLNVVVRVDGGLYALNGAVSLINDFVMQQQDCVTQSSSTSNPPPFSSSMMLSASE
jgi:hypothetical protein